MEPEISDVYAAMEEFGHNETMRKILKQLISPGPLAVYTLRKRRDFSLHLWARLFALRWLKGDIHGAAALIREER